MKEDAKKSLTGADQPPPDKAKAPDEAAKSHATHAAKQTDAGREAHEATKGHVAPVKAPGPAAVPVVAAAPAQPPAPGQPLAAAPTPAAPVPEPDSQQRAAELEMAKKEGGGQIQPEAPGAADKQRSRQIVADATTEAARMGRTGAGGRNLKEVLPGEPAMPLPKPTARDLEIEARHDDGRSGARLFRVQLRDCAPMNVRATSAGQAWLKYKRKAGIIKTENEPTIMDAPPDAEADIP